MVGRTIIAVKAGPPWYFWFALCALGTFPRLLELPYFASLENRDFGILYAAGRLAWSNGASVYDPATLTTFAHKVLGVDVGMPYPYPPHSLFIFMPFAMLPFTWAYMLWTVLGLAFFALAAQPHIGRAPRLLPLFLPGTLVCIIFGQTGLFIGGFWLLAFGARPWALAALTIKPHIGFLAVFHDRRAILPAVLVGGALILASVLAFGLEAWTGWIHAMLHQAKSSSTFQDTKFAPPWVAYGLIGQVVFSTAAAAFLLRKFDVFTAATATLLISPYSYHYDMTVACLGFAVALADDRPPLQTAVLALAFLTPALMFFGSWIAPPLLLAGLWVQADRRLAWNIISLAR